jgi:hypothetical protein
MKQNKQKIQQIEDIINNQSYKIADEDTDFLHSEDAQGSQAST